MLAVVTPKKTAARAITVATVETRFLKPFIMRSLLCGVEKSINEGENGLRWLAIRACGIAISGIRRAPHDAPTSSGADRAAATEVFDREVADAGNGLGARRIQGGKLASFLVGNDRCTVSDMEVIPLGNLSLYGVDIYFVQNIRAHARLS
jgi:hypothetical protein